MKQHTVLICSFFFPPDISPGSARVVKIAQYLLESGWKPYVLTVTFEDTYCEEDYVLPNGSSIPVFRVPGFFPKELFKAVFSIQQRDHRDNTAFQFARDISNTSFLTRTAKGMLYPFLFIPDEFIGWKRHAVRKIYDLHQQFHFDLILTSSPPNSVHHIGATIRRQCHMTWAADLRDAWSVWQYWYNPYRWTWRRSVDKWNIRRILQTCDGFTGASEGIGSDLQKLFNQTGSVPYTTIYNGYDDGDWQGISPRKFTTPVAIVHTGNFSLSRRAESLIKAVGAVKRTSPYAASQVGIYLAGRMVESDTKLIQREDLTDLIHILGSRTTQECISYCLGASVLLVIVDDSDFSHLMVTTKLLEYLALSKPIWMIGPPCEGLEILRRSGVPHYYAHSNDIQAIQNQFQNILHGEFPDSTPDRTYIQQFHRRFQIEKLSQVLHHILSGRTMT